MWKIIKWFFGILFVLYLIGSVINKSNNNTKSNNTGTNIGVETKKPEEHATTPEPKLTSTELLKMAKKLLANNEPDAAILNLQMIEIGSKEYPEGQKLLTRVNKELDQKVLNAEAKIKIASRKEYGKVLENYLLDNAKMDTKITTSGKDYTTLKIEYILTSRVMVNELTKDGKLPSIWEQMGFKTVVFTDGYYHTWTMDLINKKWK
jgi:hypothetical protein